MVGSYRIKPPEECFIANGVSQTHFALSLKQKELTWLTLYIVRQNRKPIVCLVSTFFRNLAEC